LIRHAQLRLAVPIRPLPVAMIQPPFQTPLMAAVGPPALFEPCGGAAGGAAIAMAAITVLADPEHRLTSAAATNPLPQNHFAVSRHVRRGRGLDNGSRSCQVRTSWLW